MGCFFALAHHGGQHNEEKEIDLRQTKCKATQRSHDIEISELHRVVGIAAWHARQTEEVHGEEGDVKGNQRPPKVNLATGFVVHHACPLRYPVVVAGKHGVQRPGHQHIVEVRHHVIGVLQLDINGRHRQDQAGEPAHGEYEDKTHGEQHWRLEGHRALPHGGNPVENLDGGRHCNQHRRIHEKQLASYRHTGGEHVVGPDDEGQNGNARGGIHHGGIAEQLFAREGRHDLADDAKSRQDHDVNLGVAEEPKDVLVHHWVPATCRVEEAGAKVAVSQGHGDGTGKHRHHGNQQISGDQPSPGEHGHLHQRHARRTHVEDGDNDVDRAHDR